MPTDPRMVNKKKVINSVSSMGLCSGVTAVLSIVQLSIVARFLTPDDYGIFALANIIVGAAGAFLAGVPLAVIQRDTVSDEESGSMQNWVYLVALILMVTVVSLSGAYSYAVGIPEVRWVTCLLAVNLLVTAMALMHQVWLRRELVMQKIAYANVVAALFAAGTTVLLAWLGAGYWALAYAAVVRTLVVTIFIRAKSGWSVLPTRSMSAARPLLVFGLSRGLDQTLGQFTSKLDQLAIGSLMGQSSLGHYNVASNVARRPADLMNPVLGSVMFPVYARLKGNSAQISQAFSGSVQLLALIMLSIAVSVSLLASEIVSILLGAKWVDASPVLAVIAFYFALIMMELPCRQIAQAYGHSSRLLYWNLFSGLFILLGIVPGVLWRSDIVVVASGLVFARLLLYMVSFKILTSRTDFHGAGVLLTVVVRMILPLLMTLGLWYYMCVERAVEQRIVCLLCALSLLCVLNGKTVIGYARGLVA